MGQGTRRWWRRRESNPRPQFPNDLQDKDLGKPETSTLSRCRKTQPPDVKTVPDDMVGVAAAWDNLPEAIRNAIVTMVKAVGKGG